MPLVFMFQADRLPCLSRKRGDLVRAALEMRFFIDAQHDFPRSQSTGREGAGLLNLSREDRIAGNFG
jgi:hypothetical protein